MSEELNGLRNALAFAADQAVASTAPGVAYLDKYVLVPEDYKVHTFKEDELHLNAPVRKRAKVLLRDVASFISYWKIHQEPRSVIFADDSVASFTAVLDYHGGAGEPAGFRHHVATLALQRTVEWATWLGSNGKKMSQADFGLFIEDNTPDIVEPSAAEMLEISREFTAKKDVEFTGGVRLQSGQHAINYSETVSASVGKGKIEVPERFKINVPPFVGFGSVTVEARLRYRIEGGKLMLWYDLIRPHKVMESAFHLAVSQISDGCERSVLLGVAS